MKKTLPIEIPKEVLAEYCRKYHVKKLSYFGSVLRDDFNPQSDIDILVEFEPGHVPGLFGLAGMEAELTSLVKRKVDIRTVEDLSRYFRQDVINSAEVGFFEG